MATQTENSHPQEVKCVVVGDGEVGKTCMLMAYTTNSFPEEYTPTVFEQWGAKVVVDNKQYQMCLCDTAGQEGYDRLRPLSYPDTNVFLLCYSVTNLTSLENIKDKWYPEVKHYVPSAHVILVGTKADLRSADGGANKEVKKQQAKSVAKEIKAFSCLECSALTRMGLKEVFDEAVRVTVSGGQRKRSQCSVL